MSRRHALWALAFACALSPARAHAQAGTSAASFLSIGSGASVLAMSGATLATGSDLAAAAWNPATLARVDALQFALAHTPLPGGATQDWLSAGGPLRGSPARWALQALLHQEGAIEARDASNQPAGSLSVSDLAVAARLAYPLGRAFHVGAGAEFVRESLAGVSGTGLAFEAGVRADAGAFGAALAARHAGGSMRYGVVRYDLPAVIAAGVSWQDAARGMRLALDVESPSHYYKDVRVGGEWFVHERVAVRAGYRQQLGQPSTESLSGASFGMGTGVGPMWMDYAFMPGGEQGSGEHRIGLTFRPGQPYRAGSEGGVRMRAPASGPEPPAVAAPRRDAVARPEAVVKEPRVDRPEDRRDRPAPAAPAPREAAAPERIVTPSVPPPAEPAAAKPAPVVPVQADTVIAVRPAPRPQVIVVGEGETLAMLAKRWSVTVPALMMANDLVRDSVAPGTRLKLPRATR